jgi:hypothetical protein
MCSNNGVRLGFWKDIFFWLPSSLRLQNSAGSRYPLILCGVLEMEVYPFTLFLLIFVTGHWTIHLLFLEAIKESEVTYVS